MLTCLTSSRARCLSSLRPWAISLEKTVSSIRRQQIYLRTLLSFDSQQCSVRRTSGASRSTALSTASAPDGFLMSVAHHSVDR
eukprot:1417214-Pyramimonas_sp.AAC.1